MERERHPKSEEEGHEEEDSGARAGPRASVRGGADGTEDECGAEKRDTGCDAAGAEDNVGNDESGNGSEDKGTGGGGGGSKQRESSGGTFRIGHKRLLEDLQPLPDLESDASISVGLAQQIDKFQNVLARNSILLREVQSAYYSLSTPQPPSASSALSTATASALRATTLRRGGEMLAEINNNLTQVALLYDEVSRTFMRRINEERGPVDAGATGREGQGGRANRTNGDTSAAPGDTRGRHR